MHATKLRETTRILICEDDPAQLEWLDKSLNERGFEVDVAQDGDEAFSKWKLDGPYDLVITDFEYPGRTIRNGLELITAIRTIDSLQAFVVQTSDRNLTAPLGVPLFHKPYPIRRLLNLMKTPVRPPAAG